MHVLFVKPSSLGDVVHTLPAARLVKKNPLRAALPGW